ncbi:ABC transporter ATP-binding protein [Paenibacillus sp. HW567]|uniref:ABC transporter ATP-binding protein n=1 Tax=Paenibacillus sp. HW567 TaxID=1034769 RepID=UPI0003778B1E|nr:ABC transporter ATP-binding protein [Paenibacillus sp. HW567]
MSFDEVAIKVSNVSKVYKMYNTPADRLKDLFNISKKQKRHQAFSALNSITFEVKKGDTVGIVGKNGSGKSTLLQIIAGTVTPTTGTVEVFGKVVALLELGSGFNPEFTGRENVYLNATMFGISRETIEGKFSEIESFADIGEHIDQPVKTYSSGMFARLAFSVAIHMEPDILIIDEILAVGDAAFQAKCVSKMRQLKDNGVSLLFVSHSVDAIKSMCHSAILISHGNLVDEGTSEKITNHYLAMIRDEMNQYNSNDSFQNNESTEEVPNIQLNSGFRYGSGLVSFRDVYMANQLGEPTKAYEFGEQASLICSLYSKEKVQDINVSFLIRDITGIDLFGTTMFDEHVILISLEKHEKKIVKFNFPIWLRQGSYSVSVAVNSVTDRDYSDVFLFEQIDGASSFEVIRKIDRPVHYKVHVPIRIETEGGLYEE